MIDVQTAKKIVEKHFFRPARTGPEEIVVVDRHTIEKAYGWIFFVQSRGYLETGDELRFVIGVGPIVVMKQDGCLHQLESGRPPSAVIEIFEATQVEARFLDPARQSEYAQIKYLEAIKKEEISLVKQMLKAGVPVDARNYSGITGLFLAIQNSDICITKVLLAHGADVNTRALDGGTVLMRAVWRESYRLVKLLLRCGADIHAQDNDGKTVLQYSRADTSIHTLLKKRGAV